MVHFSPATDPAPVALFWLCFFAWVAIWIGFVVRDRGSGVQNTADRGSRTLIALSLWCGVLLAFLVAWLVPAAQIAASGWPLLIGGIVLMWVGIALRLWAVRTLGHYFRTVVVIQDDHQIISAGPYRLTRHPSYAGSLLTLAGIGLALGSWLSIIVAVLCALVGFARRIMVEESTMRARFGDAYTAYARRTWRLVPFIW